MIRILLFSILVLLLISAKCKETEPSSVNIFARSNFKFNYALDQAVRTFFMDSRLKEISGVEVSLNEKHLYAVNDEKANLYVLDILTGEVLDKIDFGKPDDYEALCMVDNLVYIVESNGNLKVVDPDSKKRVATHDCSLSSKNNIEGLAFDPTSNKLLLAAKGHSKLDGHKKGKRSIFSIPLKNFKVDKNPYLSLNLKKIGKEIMQGSEKVNINDKLLQRIQEFAPSGLAIHPITKDLYMLSARGQSLTVVSPDGIVNAIVLLPKMNNPQPEGICFKKDGTMFITNEGVLGRGRIDEFPMK